MPGGNSKSTSKSSVLMNIANRFGYKHHPTNSQSDVCIDNPVALDTFDDDAPRGTTTIAVNGERFHPAISYTSFVAGKSGKETLAGNTAGRYSQYNPHVFISTYSSNDDKSRGSQSEDHGGTASPLPPDQAISDTTPSTSKLSQAEGPNISDTPPASTPNDTPPTSAPSQAISNTPPTSKLSLTEDPISNASSTSKPDQVEDPISDISTSKPDLAEGPISDVLPTSPISDVLPLSEGIVLSNMLPTSPAKPVPAPRVQRKKPASGPSDQPTPVPAPRVKRKK